MTVLQHLNFSDFDKLFVGFDRLNRDLENRVRNNPITNYPRYNLVSVGDEAYRIEMALPGWSKENIEVTQRKNTLKIEGKDKLTTSEEETYIHKGLSGKPFNREFSLGSWVEVDSCTFKDGMLVVDLSVNVPEAEKPKSINIG
jgi:molecular chaperone IbpA